MKFYRVTGVCIAVATAGTVALEMLLEKLERSQERGR